MIQDLVVSSFRESLRELAEPVRGMRVLLYGFSGRGFPGGDGAAEAQAILPDVGVQATWTHAIDPRLPELLAEQHDVVVVCHTGIDDLVKAPAGLWSPARKRALWFWDLRPGTRAKALRGRVDRAFVGYDGAWSDTLGERYAPEQWTEALGCPTSYLPQGAPLREPELEEGGPRVLFVGNTDPNGRYHGGRPEICAAAGATVMNHGARALRLALEISLPRLYRSSRYCLSMSAHAPGYTSVRTYSILACGGLLVLHRFPGAELLFDDLEHAILFDGPEDLPLRLRELDEKPAERDRIAMKGRLLHARKHTVAHRVLSICRRFAGIEGFEGWL